MSETIKIILAMITVGIALAALIVNSVGNVRADMRDIRVEIRDNRARISDIRAEISDIRAEIGKLGQDMQTLTSRVTHLEELLQRFFLSRQEAVAGTTRKGKTLP